MKINTYTHTNKLYALVLLVLLQFLIMPSSNITAQPNDDYNRFDVMVSPRITIGYTFGAGVNCGLDLSTSVYKFKDIFAGVHISYYLVFVKNSGMHRIRGIMLSAETEYVTGRIGFGRVSRSWGMRNVNKAGVYGLMIDAAASFDEYRAPWIGFKTFIFNRSKWPYYDFPSYTSAYAYFKPKNIKIYKQDPPKIIEEDDEE